MAKFNIGDIVKIKEGKLWENMTPTSLVRRRIIKNKFTVVEIIPMNKSVQNMFGGEGVWISLKECCKSGEGCIAHPSQYFENVTKGTEKVIFT